MKIKLELNNENIILAVLNGLSLKFRTSEKEEKDFYHKTIKYILIELYKQEIDVSKNPYISFCQLIKITPWIDN